MFYFTSGARHQMRCSLNHYQAAPHRIFCAALAMLVCWALSSAPAYSLPAYMTPASPHKPSALAQSATQYGFVQKADNQVLLEIESGNVNPSTPITVVMLGKNQSYVSAQFVRKLGVKDLTVPQLDRYKISPADSGRCLNIYVIKLARPLSGFNYGIAALLPAASFMMEGSKVAASVGSLPPAHFRSCVSQEGVHFSVWLGKELTGARIWHYYLALGYDVDAGDKSNCKCQPNDY